MTSKKQTCITILVAVYLIGAVIMLISLIHKYFVSDEKTDLKKALLRVIFFPLAAVLGLAIAFSHYIFD